MIWKLAACAVLILAACGDGPTYKSGVDLQPDPVAEPDPNPEPNPQPDPRPDPEPGDCRNACPDSFACQNGEVVACAPEAACGEPCFCGGGPVASCLDGCEEGQRAQEIEALCSPCACETDGDCPVGSFCDGCECVEACGCVTDADCGFEELICVECLCIEAPSPECVDLCAARETRLEEDGFCPIEFMEDRSCEVSCTFEQTLGSEAYVAAVEECFLNDPLCFQTLDDCLFAALHPDGAQSTMVLSGRGFDRFDGKLVRAAVQSNNQTSESMPAVVGGGGWVQTWDANIFASGQVTVFFYIDINDNGECDREGDFGSFAIMERGEDLEMPSFEGRVESADTMSFPFACDVF